MFTWSYENSIEVDLPFQKAWDVYTDPSNWPKWEDKFEACILEGGFRTGSKIKAKIKDKPIKVMILVAEVKPHHECKFLVKVPFFTQENLCVFERISPEKTKIILKVCVINPFVFFVKSALLKNIEEAHSKCLKFFAEITS